MYHERNQSYRNKEQLASDAAFLPHSKSAEHVINTMYELYGGGKIYTPKEFGARGGAIGGRTGGSYETSTKTFSAVNYAGQAIDFRKYLRVGDIIGYGGNETIIEDFDSSGNIITKETLNVNNVLWYAGPDDNAAIQACIDKCIASGGGVVHLGLDNYLIGLSQEDYDNGKKSALTIDKASGVPFAMTGGQHSQHVSKLFWRWKMGYSEPCVGDAIGNVWDQAMDFCTFSNFSIDGTGFAVSGSTRESAIRFQNPFTGFVSTDSHSRLYNLSISQCGNHGVHYTGRGEFHIEHCNIGSTNKYGVFMEDTYDNKLINNTIAATGKTGLRFEGGSSSTNVIGGKIFYIGKNGGTDEADNSAIGIINTQWRGGACQIQDVNLQEIRGSGLYCENSGAIIYKNIISQGIGRQSIDWGSTPTIVADIRMKGDFNRHVTIDVMSYGFPLYADQLSDNGDNIKTWGHKTHFVYIDGETTGTDPSDGTTQRTKGTEKISGNLEYATPEVRSDFTLDFGTRLENTTASGGVQVLGGGGTSNGRNTRLTVNGVALT